MFKYLAFLPALVVYVVITTFMLVLITALTLLTGVWALFKSPGAVWELLKNKG